MLFTKDQKFFRKNRTSFHQRNATNWPKCVVLDLESGIEVSESFCLTDTRFRQKIHLQIYSKFNRQGTGTQGSDVPNERVTKKGTSQAEAPLFVFFELR